MKNTDMNTETEAKRDEIKQMTQKLSEAMKAALSRAQDLHSRKWFHYCGSTLGREATVNALVRRGMLKEILPAEFDFSTPILYSITEKGLCP